MTVAWYTRWATAAWAVWVAMAPYLLFGFLIAGILSVWLSADWVRRHLGGGGWRASLRAALLGVPLPLCSCSVIPVAASLRGHGASRGATAAFMMSTPQVGLNSLIVTYGVLGPFMAVARAVVAFFSGWICGTVVDAAVAPDGGAPVPAEAATPSVANGAPPLPAWLRVLRHGFVVLPESLASPLLIGISISALLGAWLPPGYFADRLEPGLFAMLLLLLIGIPVYVCSTSSIPVALALMHAGVPQGAVLVFLITGPATNAATLATLFRLLGRRATMIYLLILTLSALLAGWFLDAWLLVRNPDLVPYHMPEAVASPWQHAMGVVLAAVLLWPLAVRLARRLSRRRLGVLAAGLLLMAGMDGRGDQTDLGWMAGLSLPVWRANRRAEIRETVACGQAVANARDELRNRLRTELSMAAFQFRIDARNPITKTGWHETSREPTAFSARLTKQLGSV